MTWRKGAGSESTGSRTRRSQTGGVSLDGRRFAAINYARMARLRPVTGYPQAWDWTDGVSAPEDDGVFVVDSETGTKRLVVSFRQLADALRRERPEIDSMPLFINHTLWSRSGNTLFFFARANFRRPGRLNAAFTVAADGSGLRRLETHIGGHPEWDAGSLMIGSIARRQAVFDVDSQRMVGLIGEGGSVPGPRGGHRTVARFGLACEWLQARRGDALRGPQPPKRHDVPCRRLRPIRSGLGGPSVRPCPAMEPDGGRTADPWDDGGRNEADVPAPIARSTLRRLPSRICS